MQTRRRQRTAGSGILSKDPYGLIWVAFIYLALLVGKWWVLSPADPETSGCVVCAVAVIWLISVLLHSLLIVFWINWSRSYIKGPVFVFFLAMMCLILGISDFYLVKIVISKLLNVGLLSWPETQIEYLIEVFIPHSIALMVITSIFYSMLRTLLCPDLVQKPLVYTFVGIMLLAVGPLYFMGLVVY
jgi:hypothetical protein